MATSRMIKTSFWDDAWIKRLSPTERYLFLYLLTSPMANIAGIYEITIDRIQFDTGMKRQEIKSTLEAFKDARKAIHHDDTWMIIPNWPKHQELKSELTKKGVNRVLEAIPIPVLQKAKEYSYKYAGIDEVLRKGLQGACLQSEGVSSENSDRTSPSDYSTLLNSTKPNSTLDLTEFDTRKHEALGKVLEGIEKAVAERSRDDETIVDQA